MLLLNNLGHANLFYLNTVYIRLLYGSCKETVTLTSTVVKN